MRFFWYLQIGTYLLSHSHRTTFFCKKKLGKDREILRVEGKDCIPAPSKRGWYWEIHPWFPRDREGLAVLYPVFACKWNIECQIYPPFLWNMEHVLDDWVKTWSHQVRWPRYMSCRGDETASRLCSNCIYPTPVIVIVRGCSYIT